MVAIFVLFPVRMARAIVGPNSQGSVDRRVSSDRRDRRYHAGVPLQGRWRRERRRIRLELAGKLI